MRYDIAVIGGGIVGLASARELLRRHPHLKLIVLEKEASLAAHQTGHNSGVIHAGIYYRPGSLKAKLCVEGREALWRYCDARRIPYRNVGKLIVATDARELPPLETLYARGLRNGVTGLRLIDRAGIAQREPFCAGIAAIYSPVTGIVDFARVAHAYADDVRSDGGIIETERNVTSIRARSSNTIVCDGGAQIEAKYVLTCAGLQSDRIAKMTGGKTDPKIVPFRGDYLLLRPAKRHLVNGNINPVPDPAFPFLGPHFTPRMNGEVWLGPNAVLAFAREGYRLSTLRALDLAETLTYPGFIKLCAAHFRSGTREMYRDVVRTAFVRTLQRYVPQLDVADTLPGPSGVRAQAMTRDGALVDDFVFDGGATVLHVRNAPSPAATAALAIARFVADDADRRFGFGSHPAVV